MGLVHTEGLVNKKYKAPGSKHLLWVDAALNIAVLNRLNGLPKVKVYATCAGHRTGKGDRQAHVIFSAVDLEDLRLYLIRLSATFYAGKVEWYKGNGSKAMWRLEIRREEKGQAPLKWWHELVDLLEDDPDCRVWMSDQQR